ncbi:YkvA family protein [Luteipulveratus flavus]|uniref:YkvA family protein n=1 Tax=Luteipulveratus flavus TaxID=3031728 RepID=A0ABT6C7C7_9MICO|nr:YkvA family protein [Luteipulveratus sp. YIM 133296]MDF8264227.1 YkvA family protein [Luteipulveratus sp. YIM 133296]
MPTPRPVRWTGLRQLSAAVRTASAPGAPSLATRMSAVPRLVRASLSGQYDGCTPAHLAALAAAAAYVVSPVDLLPEAVLSVVGLADDAVVLAWFAAALVRDTDDFLAWEKARERTVRGETVR